MKKWRIKKKKKRKMVLKGSVHSVDATVGVSSVDAHDKTRLLVYDLRTIRR